jgi:hypothetical protein
MRSLALAVSLLAVGTEAAQAQTAPASPLPQTVRLQLRNQDYVQGYLRGRSKDEVVIYTSEGRYRHVPLADVRRFEIRSQTGSHLKRGALIGVAVWVGAVAAASRGSLDKWGVASWQSGAVLAGSVGLGAVIGSQVPRYGWRATAPSALGRGPTPSGLQPQVHDGGRGLQVTLRF